MKEFSNGSYQPTPATDLLSMRVFIEQLLISLRFFLEWDNYCADSTLKPIQGPVFHKWIALSGGRQPEEWGGGGGV